MIALSWTGIQLILMAGSVYGTNCGIFECDEGEYCCSRFFQRCYSNRQEDLRCRLIVYNGRLSFWQIVAICISIVFVFSCLCGLFKCWMIKKRKNNSRSSRSTGNISSVPTIQRPVHSPNIINQPLPQPNQIHFTADPPTYSSMGIYQQPVPLTPPPPAYNQQEKDEVNPPNYNDLYKSSAT